VQLQPVAVGLPLPSVQHCVLRNDGDYTLAFHLDRQKLDILKEKNHGFAVRSCDVTGGVIPAGGTYMLPINFWPIEAKEVAGEIDIEVNNGEPVALTIAGVGVDPRDHSGSGVDGATTAYADGRNRVPETQHVAVLGQQAVLSHERLYFGDVAMFSVSRRVVFVRNTAADGHAVSFEFDTHAFSNVVDVSPATGYLAAGESKAVRVTFQAFGASPGVYNFDLHCRITDEQVAANHNQAVAAADQAREEAQSHFTFTDAGRTGRGRAGGHRRVGTEQGVRSVHGAEVDLGAFPGQALKTGFQPAYSANLSLALAPPAPEPGAVHATVSTVKAQTLRRTALESTGQMTGPFVQTQTLSGDMHVFEERFAADGSSAAASAIDATTKVGQERPSSATRLQRLTGKKTTLVSDTDLRTTKYQALPPIRLQLQPDARAAAASPPPLAPPTVLFVGVTAHVHHVAHLPADDGGAVGRSLWRVGRGGRHPLVHIQGCGRQRRLCCSRGCNRCRRADGALPADVLSA
jgi:hypothetical protein